MKRLIKIVMNITGSRPIIKLLTICPQHECEIRHFAPNDWVLAQMCYISLYSISFTSSCHAVCNILRLHCSFDLIQFELNYAPFKWPLLEWYKLTINAMQI